MGGSPDGRAVCVDVSVWAMEPDTRLFSCSDVVVVGENCPIGIGVLSGPEVVDEVELLAETIMGPVVVPS